MPKLRRAIRERDGAAPEPAGPRVVVSVGGYASLPAVLAARRLRIPIVVVSYDRRPGRASQLAARFAAASAVAFPGSGLPRPGLTGAPLRRADASTSTRPGTGPRRGRRSACPPDRFVVLVVGGSLGSAALNDAVRGFVGRRPTARDLAVRHVVGERSDDDDATAVGRTGARRHPVHVVGYEDRMPQAYAAADLVVRRAPGPAPWPSWPPSGCRRSSCRGRAPPRTTRPPTPASSAERRRRGAAARDAS